MIGITFGQCLFQAGRSRVGPDSDVHFGLLLLVCSRSGEGCPRDDAMVLWSGSDPDHARHSLRQALYRLRQMGFPVHLRGGRIVLDSALQIDMAEVLRGPLTNGRLQELGTLPFLPGYAPRLNPAFAEWVEALRVRVASALRLRLVEAVQGARQQALFRDVQRLARGLLDLDPLNETATLALAEALAMDGSKVEALRLLESYEDEVGAVEESLRIPARTLRRRVSEHLDDSLMPRRYEVPFVGRAAEFAALRRAFAESRSGLPRCAVITGEAGIGKTRLAGEAVRLAVLDGAVVSTYACSAGDSLSPLSSILHVTHALLSLPGALGCAQEHLLYLRRVVSRVDTSGGGGGAGGGMEELGAEVAYAQLVYSLAELASAIADESPLVLFLDDAQRLHPTSWRVFTDLVDRISGRGVLLIMAARALPSWFSTLGIAGSDGRCQVVRLETLGALERLQFLAVWSEKNGVTVGPAEARALSDASAGNPFYLSELAAHLGRGGAVGSAPPSIRALIELQHAATSREAQRVLAVIALLQPRGTIERVAGVLQLGAAQFAAVLDELEVAGLVSCAGVELRAKHDLVAEVAVGLALPAVSALLRVRVATVLEEEAERTGNLELLGDSLTHWERVGDRRRVFEVGMRLGAQSLLSGMAEGASRAFERAACGADDELQLHRAVDAQIEAQFFLQNWGHVLALTRRRRGRPVQLEARRLTMSDVYAAEADYWSGTFSIPPEFANHIRNPALAQAVRLRAAELLAIAADHEGDQRAIAEVLDSIADIRGRSPGSHAFLDLVLVTATGRSHEISQGVRDFLNSEPTRSEAHAARALRRAGDALCRAGLRGEALDLLRSSRQYSERLRLSPHLYSTDEKIYRALATDLRLEEAEVSYQSLCRTKETSGYSSWWHPHVEATKAWLDADREKGLNALRELPRMTTTWPAGVRFAVTFARVAAHVAADLAPTRDLLDDAVRFARQPTCLGIADLYIAVLLDALLRSGDLDTARESAAAYASRLTARGIAPSQALSRALARTS